MKRVRVTVGGKVVSEVDVDRELTIGRKPPADIVLPETEVSGRHAKLRPDSGGLFVTIQEMEVTSGRDAKQAQIAIAHQSVSGRHGKIKFENGRFLVEDLKSVNGTFVDGNPVVVATPIESDRALTFGTVDCLFVQ